MDDDVPKKTTEGPIDGVMERSAVESIESYIADKVL